MSMTAPTSREELLALALEDCLREHGGFTIKGECERKARAALAFTDPAQGTSSPEAMGRAYYLARYEKDGANWEANDHKMLWIRMAQRYHELLGSPTPSTERGGK